MKELILFFVFSIVQFYAFNQNSIDTSGVNGVFLDNRNGQQYPWIKIGTQIWMGKNLNIGMMIKTKKDQTNNELIEKYCYKNDSTNCLIYGGFYQWEEMMQYNSREGSQGICPSGWHLPTKQEWITLFIYLGGETDAGGKLKSTTTPWFAPNKGATNESGFNALPSGWRPLDGKSDALTMFSIFQTSTASSSDYAFSVVLRCDEVKVQVNDLNKKAGFSVRCIRN